MKTISIYGDNRFERPTKARTACRGIVVRDRKILLSYEVNADQWAIPGGGVEMNEGDEACCVREVAEETGLIVKPQLHYLTIDEYYEEYLYISHYFVCEVIGQTERMLTPREKAAGMEPRWMMLDEAISIFSKHQEYADHEEKRGMYLREHLALMEYQSIMS